MDVTLFPEKFSRLFDKKIYIYFCYTRPSYFRTSSWNNSFIYPRSIYSIKCFLMRKQSTERLKIKLQKSPVIRVARPLLISPEILSTIMKIQKRVTKTNIIRSTKKTFQLPFIIPRLHPINPSELAAFAETDERIWAAERQDYACRRQEKNIINITQY